tara:strand:- start:141 stop:488 length:348 start_codon:yes stop_codon:yes gene_type:complete
VEEEEEKKPRKRFRLSSEMIQSIREVKLGIRNAKERYKNYKGDPKKAKAHKQRIAKLNKQSSDAIKKAKDRDSGKSDWKNTEAGKKHMKHLKKITDAAKQKARNRSKSGLGIKDK